MMIKKYLEKALIYVVIGKILFDATKIIKGN